MLNIYKRAFEETGYRASYFHQMVTEQGGYDAAMTLIHSSKPSEGYTALHQLGRLDLTVEALILRPEWLDVFTDQDRLAAYRRLQAYQYPLPPDSWHPSA